MCDYQMKYGQLIYYVLLFFCDVFMLMCDFFFRAVDVLASFTFATAGSGRRSPKEEDEGYLQHSSLNRTNDVFLLT